MNTSDFGVRPPVGPVEISQLSLDADRQPRRRRQQKKKRGKPNRGKQENAPATPADDGLEHKIDIYV